MHEAGLARAVVARLRDGGFELRDVRLLVRGGHHEPEDFDAAMRAHLSGELSGEDSSGLQIVHVPFGHLCLACGRSFDAAALDESCPGCGGDALPSILDEQVEIELL